MHINVFKYTRAVWKEPHFTTNDEDKNYDSPCRAGTLLGHFYINELIQNPDGVLSFCQTEELRDISFSPKI